MSGWCKRGVGVGVSGCRGGVSGVLGWVLAGVGVVLAGCWGGC